MRKSRSSGCEVTAFALETGVTVCVIDPYDSNANRLIASSPELCHLISEIANHSVDLFYHCLSENLYLRPDFHRRDLPAPHMQSGLKNRCLAWDDLTKRPIAAPCFYSSAPICHINHTLAFLDPRNQSCGTAKGEEILVEPGSNQVTLIGRAVFIRPSFKELPECGKQEVLAVRGGLSQGDGILQQNRTALSIMSNSQLLGREHEYRPRAWKLCLAGRRAWSNIAPL